MAEQQRRVVDNIVDAFYNEHKASADEFFIAMSRLEDDMTRPKAMTYFDEAKARALGAAPPPIPPPPGPGHSGGPAALPPMLRYGGRQMTADVFAPGQKSAAAAIRGVRATATSKVKQDLPVNVDVGAGRRAQGPAGPGDGRARPPRGPPVRAARRPQGLARVGRAAPLDALPGEPQRQPHRDPEQPARHAPQLLGGVAGVAGVLGREPRVEDVALRRRLPLMSMMIYRREKSMMKGMLLPKIKLARVA